MMPRRCGGTRHWRAGCALQTYQSKNTLCKQTVAQETLVQWSQYLVDDLHIRVGDRIMQQLVGVGYQLLPWLANLTLFMYDLEHFSSEISQLKPCEINFKSPTWQRLRDLSFCTRYIDDLSISLVDEANFQETAKQIYPQESGLVLGESVQWTLSELPPHGNLVR